MFWQLAAILNALLFGCMYWQQKDVAGAARDKINSATNLLDATCFIEASWGQAYEIQRARLRRDVSSGVLSVTAHTVVCFMLTLIRGAVVATPTMTVGWFMVGYDTTVGSCAKIMNFEFNTRDGVSKKREIV